MSGYSYDWDYIKTLFSAISIIAGTFLLLEHLFMFNGFDLFDFIGHEYYGIFLIVLGFIIKIKWKQLPSILRCIKKGYWLGIIDEGKR
jgi:hypothetical protein